MGCTKMAIAMLVVDDTKGEGANIARPDWDIVEAEIRRMDGRRFTSVGLMLENDENFLIGDGGDKYVVGVSLNGELHSLKNNCGSPGEYVTIVAGQPVDYPGDEIVSLDEVLKTAKWFFDNNTLCPDCVWFS
jgi:hypothetical protein